MRKNDKTELALAGAFEASAPTLAGAGAPWLDGLRQAAIAAFRTNGLPGRRVESWRYTGLVDLAKPDFAPATAAGAARLAAVPADTALPLDGACRIVFVNGFLRADLSDLDRLPDGVTARGLGDLLAHEPAVLEGRMAPVGEARDGALAALNAAFMEDGLVLDVAEGVKVETPIHLVSLGYSDDSAIAFHPRHVIHVGRGAALVLAESHSTCGANVLFSNGVMDIALGEGAALTHGKLQDEGAESFHVALTRLTLADNAVYDGFVLQRGAALARNEVHVAIDGKRAECRLNGAYLAAGRQHLDNTTVIEHRAPGSRSSQMFKGVLDGHARGVFQGRIAVARDAQKTDARQVNKTLLLSRDAEIDSKPELEIYADDVKCGHGATVGELEDMALFYLRARGIDEATARDMLVSAFLSEAVGEMRHEALAEAFASRIAGWVEARHAAEGRA